MTEPEKPYPVGCEVYVFATMTTGTVLEVDENKAVKVKLSDGSEAVYWYRRNEVAYLGGSE